MNSLHVLYLHLYFASRKGNAGTRSLEMAKGLIAKGHRVTMICPGLHTEPELSLKPGEVYREVDVEGIHCVPIAAAFGDGRKGTGISAYKRMLLFYQFASLAIKVGKKLDRPDVVYATSPPLHVGLGGRGLAKHFRVPFVFEVRDQWPEGLVLAGVLKNPLAIWWLSRIEKKLYRAADHIVALAPGMKKGVAAVGFPESRITTIPNGSDLDLFHPDLNGQSAREQLGVGDRFTAIYFGAMGKVNGLDYAVKAAKVLKDRGNDRIAIVLHGDGGQRAELEAMAAEWKLDNLIFSGPSDRETVAKIVAGCDACLTILVPAPGLTCSPNKLFDAFAAGRPVVLNVPGWPGETVEKNKCGCYVPPDDPEAMANALEKLADDPQLCAQMSRNGRALAEREFSRQILVDQLENVLTNSVNEQR